MCFHPNFVCFTILMDVISFTSPLEIPLFALPKNNEKKSYSDIESKSLLAKLQKF